MPGRASVPSAPIAPLRRRKDPAVADAVRKEHRPTDATTIRIPPIWGAVFSHVAPHATPCGELQSIGLATFSAVRQPDERGPSGSMPPDIVVSKEAEQS